jgi:hypothetical protein
LGYNRTVRSHLRCLLVGAATMLGLGACIPEFEPIGSTVWDRQDFAPGEYVRVVESRGAEVVVLDDALHVLSEDGSERWSLASGGSLAYDGDGNLRVLSRGEPTTAESVTIYAAADGAEISRQALPLADWRSIAVDTEGSTWVAGVAPGVIDLGGGPLGTNQPHLVLLRLAADGTYQASNSLGTDYFIWTLMPLPSGGVALVMGTRGVFAFDVTASPEWEYRTNSLKTAFSHESGELSLIAENAVIRLDSARQERWRAFIDPYEMAVIGEDLIVSSRKAFGEVDAPQTTLRQLDAAGNVVAREALPESISLAETTSPSAYWLQIGGGITVDLHDREVSAPELQTIVAGRAL